MRLFVWDFPTRAFHWSLVTLVAIAWATAETDSDFWFQIHLAAGYGVLGLLVFRIIWGFAGSRHALFADFVRPWQVVRDYTKRLMTLRPPHSVGHNPLGGWMVILLLAVLAGVVATGLFGAENSARIEEDAGPLAYLVSAATASEMIEIHEALFNVLLVLVGIHIAGVITDIVLTRDNLIRAMITGYKNVAVAEPAAGAGSPPYVRAAVAVAVAAALTWFIVTL
ncbi:MAG TPA: cytochrome b/b6 domain-containing protein [Alphaproteobacteria bacterium]|nr:cytochrome b/b6 domain-containing protein [Alphaproteobacteria bacterium]